MNHNRGFTLIELIISLAVVAILSSMVITFSSAFLQDNRMSLANNDLVGSISLARSAAVSRGSDVTICASNDGASCTATAWELGWIVFSDSSANGVVDGTDQILKVNNQVGIDISVSGGSNFITFKPMGSVASACVDCFDKPIKQRLDDIFVAAIKNLTPVTSAYASGSSGSSGSGGSGSSGGSSGGSGSGPSAKCVAPSSQAKSGGSGSSGGSGGGSGSSSASLGIQQYSDYALSVLQQLSPISSAYAGSGASGGSGSSGGSASCDFGNGVQAALPASSFLICDSMRNGENGNFVSVSAVGRVSREKVSCD